MQSYHHFYIRLSSLCGSFACFVLLLAVTVNAQEISNTEIIITDVPVQEITETNSARPAPKKLVIAHRGASGYVPEHTLVAKAMAYAQGADYIEQDLVMTKDNRVIVLHDHLLEKVTNVRERFPRRHRKDGRYYVVDFTLKELKTLSIFERFEFKEGKTILYYPNRFPFGKSTFKIHTFEEEIELIQGLNHSTGNDIGIYPEIKNPAFHREEGKNISLAVLKILNAYGYTQKSHKVYLQCFDANELKMIHNELMPTLNMDIKLIQLLKVSKEYDWLFKEGGMEELVTYADGVGPSMSMIVAQDSTATDLKVTDIVKTAHAAKLEVHPYTFRREANEIPAYAKDYEDLLNIFYHQIGVDGVFTDFPDLTVNFIRQSLPINNETTVPESKPENE